MTLATTIFGLSLVANVYLLAMSGVLGQAGSSRSTTLVSGDPAQKVAVISVSGMLLEAQAAAFDRQMTAATKDSNIKAVVIEIDTPGGSVSASDEMYHRLQRFRADRPGVPVTIAMKSLATSGGYYLACAGDYLFAEPTTLTGNIGVLLPRYNLSELARKWGIEEVTIASTGAPYKNAGSMFKPEKPEDQAYMQSIVDGAFEQFKAVVKAGRGEKIATVGGRQVKVRDAMDAIANGKAYLSDEALTLGLIDAIGYPEDAQRYAANAAGLHNMTVVRLSDPPTLRDILGVSSNIGQIGDAGHAAATVNGIMVNIDGSTLTELITPRLMYLWRGGN